MTVKCDPEDRDFFNQEFTDQFVYFMGEEYRDRLTKVTAKQAFDDFLDHMEAYGYWDPFHWNIKDVKAFKEALMQLSKIATRGKNHGVLYFC